MGAVSADVEVETEIETINTIFDGESYTTTIENSEKGITVSLYNSDGYLIQQSTANVLSDTLTQNVYNENTRSNVPETTVYLISDIVKDGVVSAEYPSIPSNSIQPFGILDEPFPTDYGLLSSSVFSGYKTIGAMSSSSYTANLHRCSTNSYLETKVLEIGAGTVASTIVSILLSLMGRAGLVSSVATSLVSSAIGLVVDYAIQMPTGYKNFHYTYKCNVNSSYYSSYKFCRSKDFWFLDNSYELKGSGSGSHSGALNNYDLGNFAIQNYQGGVVEDVSCNASAS